MYQIFSVLFKTLRFIHRNVIIVVIEHSQQNGHICAAGGLGLASTLVVLVLHGICKCVAKPAAGYSAIPSNVVICHSQTLLTIINYQYHQTPTLFPAKLVIIG